MQKVCKKWSDCFASSLYAWSLQKSGSESQISPKSDQWFQRNCKSKFFARSNSLKDLTQGFGFAISPQPLMRFARNLGFWTRFLQGLCIFRCCKLIRALFAHFLHTFVQFYAILYYVCAIESIYAFSKKVLFRWETNTPQILEAAHQNWQRDGAPKLEMC